jgi:hypothetical protein
VAVLGAIQAETWRVKASVEVDAMASALSSADLPPPAALGVYRAIRAASALAEPRRDERAWSGRPLEALASEIKEIVPIVRPSVGTASSRVVTASVE